jgi:shikimate kinase
MPGAGKSTVGALLSRCLHRPLIDTDACIAAAEGRSLQDIVDTQGHLALRAIEERVLCRLDLHDSVIATGGSAVYSERVMATLRRSGVIVYLHVDYPVLEMRLTDLETRGIARAAHQSLRDLYHERVPLYRHHADVSIDCSRLGKEQVVVEICGALARRPVG